MKTLLALLSAVTVSFVAMEASAWAPLDFNYPRWKNMPVQYFINEGTIPPSIAGFGKARLDQAIASWGEPSCTFWAVQNMGNTTSTFNSNDGQNIFMWRSGTWPSQLGPVNSVIGVTMPVWDNNAELLDADIVYNNVGFCWNDSGSGNCVDTMSIAVHEDGHFLGLDHSNVSGATMEASYGGGNSLATIEQDDIDGVCALYPSMGSAVSSGSGAGNCQQCANNTANNVCSSQYQACGSSQQCQSYYNCVSQCGSQSCADNCAAQFPSGAQLYDDLVDCACMACANECAMECGNSGGSSSSSSSSSNGASSSGSPGTGGAGGAEPSTGAWTSDETEPQVNPTNDSSCSCSMQPKPIQFSAVLSAAAFAFAWLRRRSRRNSA